MKEHAPFNGNSCFEDINRDIRELDEILSLLESGLEETVQVIPAGGSKKKRV